jgi:hypothetical protein
MTPEEFVDALREVALHAAVDGALSVVEKPPGRRPRRELVESSAWYRGLSDADRAQLRVVASIVAHDVLFSVFAVLDGIRTVEATPDKGKFKLVFQKDGKEWELNPPRGPMLHEFLNAEPEPGH